MPRGGAKKKKDMPVFFPRSDASKLRSFSSTPPRLARQGRAGFGRTTGCWFVEVLGFWFFFSCFLIRQQLCCYSWRWATARPEPQQRCAIVRLLRLVSSRRSAPALPYFNSSRSALLLTSAAARRMRRGCICRFIALESDTWMCVCVQVCVCVK